MGGFFGRTKALVIPIGIGWCRLAVAQAGLEASGSDGDTQPASEDTGNWVFDCHTSFISDEIPRCVQKVFLVFYARKLQNATVPTFTIQAPLKDRLHR